MRSVLGESEAVSIALNSDKASVEHQHQLPGRSGSRADQSSVMDGAMAIVA